MSLRKGLGQPVHPFSGYVSVPGQVPGKSTPLNERPRLAPEVERLVMAKPPGLTLDRMLDAPVLRASDAVANLGLPQALSTQLAVSIQKEAAKATNQVTFQKAINATMMETGLPAEIQSLINSKAKKFYQTQLQKSGVVETFSLSELAELKKASRPAAPLKPSMHLKKDPGDAKAEKKEQDKANADAGLVLKGSFTIERNAANPEKLKKRGEAARERKLLAKGGEGSRGGKVIGHTASGEPIYESTVTGRDKQARNAQKKRLNLGHMDTIQSSNHDHPHVKRAQKEIPHIKEGLKAGKGISDAHKEVVLQALEAMRDHPLKKAFEETGGKFVAKVKKDGKTRYFYDEEKYKKAHGEHTTGEEARRRHIAQKVHETTHAAGEHGVDVTAYKDLVQKFGSKPVHDAVKGHVEGGALKFTKGRFFSAKDPAKGKE